MKLFAVLLPVILALAGYSIALDQICEDTFQADVYILLDSSSSITPWDWTKMLKLMSDLIRTLPIGPLQIQIAVGIYSDELFHMFNLNDYSDAESLADAVTSIEQAEGYTYTYLALAKVRENAYLTNPDLGARPGVKKCVILITDGLSNDMDKSISAANNLTADGMKMIVIGVSINDNTEILGMAGDKDNAYTVANFDGLKDIASDITIRICREIPAPVKQCPPQKVLDICFAVDSSGTIGAEHYKKNFVMIDKIIDAYTLGENATKVAMITYGNSVREPFSLTADRDLIKKKLQNVYYHGSETYTNRALLYCLNKIFAPGKGCRPDSGKIIITITDGRSTRPKDTLEAAKLVMAQNITIAAIGVGPYVDPPELNAIASDPAYVFRPSDYDALEKFAQAASEVACNQGKEY